MRCNNRTKTAYPPFPPSLPPPPRFSLLYSFSLSTKYSHSPYTCRINAPTGLPIVNARNLHTCLSVDTHVDRAASQCPNIPQSKTARRLFTRLLKAASIIQRALGPSDRIAPIFTINYDCTITRRTHRSVIVHRQDPRRRSIMVALRSNVSGYIDCKLK